MNEIQIFKNPDFGEVRTMEKNGAVLFCGSDVAKALGYSNPSKALADHCRGGLTNRYPIVDSLGRTQEAIFIPESDLYRLVFSSKLPTAEKFTDWVTSEVLPSIRRSGRVLSPSQVEIQRVGQPIGTQGHPCAVVAVRGVDLLRAGAGAVAVMGEKVQLKRYLMGSQSRGQQHGILHRHRGIFHSVPDVEGRQSVTDLIFQTHRPAQGVIVTAEVAD